MAVRVSSSKIGTGVAFPFEISAQGASKAGIVDASGRDLIIMSIRQIIGTILGSRVMRRDFGSRIQDIPFEPADESTVALIRHFVVGAVTRWEKRVRLTGLLVQFNPTISQLQIAVTFRIRATNVEESLSLNVDTSNMGV